MATGDAIQQIKDRLSIVDVIAPYVELHPAGKSLKGKSPFTSEKTPSFFVSPDRGMYYCFSTSQGGDMFTFVQAMEGVDFKGALKILAEKAGVELVPEDPRKRSERDLMYAALEEATKFYERTLTQSTAPQEYLKRRGVKAETRAKWRIGYAPDEWRATATHLAEKNVPPSILRTAGLTKGESGKEPYDVFRDRIMFPICDPSGRVVGFSGRILSKDSEAPKYVNSPDTDLFNKSEVLFGYDKAKQSIRSMNFSIIVEGQFDVVMSHQAGYTNTVAVSGTALTPYHVGLLQRLSSRVVLALDADKAGIAAMKRAAALMLSRGMDVKVVTLEGGKDPADIVLEDPSRYKHAIGKAVHIVEFLLSHLKGVSKDERNFKLRVRDEVLPFVAHIESHIDRAHFEGVVAAALGTPVDAVHLEVSRIEEEERKKGGRAGGTAVPPAPAREPHRRRTSVAAHVAALWNLMQPHERSVTERIVATTTGETIEAFIAAQPDAAVSPLLFTLEKELDELSMKQRHERIAALLEEWRQLHYKEQLARLRAEVAAAEGAADENRLATLLEAVKEAAAGLRSTPITAADIRETL